MESRVSRAAPCEQQTGLYLIRIQFGNCNFSFPIVMYVKCLCDVVMWTRKLCVAVSWSALFPPLLHLYLCWGPRLILIWSDSTGPLTVYRSCSTSVGLGYWQLEDAFHIVLGLWCWVFCIAAHSTHSFSPHLSVHACMESVSSLPSDPAPRTYTTRLQFANK